MLSTTPKGQVAKGLFVSSLFYPVSIISGFAWNAVLVRTLIPSEVGRYSLVMTILGIASILVNHGMTSTAQRFIPMLEERADVAGKRLVLWLTVLMPFVCGVGGGIILFLLQDLLEKNFQPGIAEAIGIVAILLPFHASLASVIKIFLGMRMASLSHFFGLVGFKLAPMLIIFFWFRLNQVGLAVDAVLAFVVGTGVVLMGGVVAVHYLVLPWVGPIVGRTVGFREIYSFSLPMMFTGFFSMMTLWADTLLLGILSHEVTSIAYYNMAYFVATLVRTFALMLPQTLLLPVLMKKFEAGEGEGIFRIYSGLARFSFFVAVPIGVILIIYGNSLLALAFGDSYRVGSGALIILVTAFILSAFWGHASTVLVTFGFARWFFVSSFLVLMVNISANWWLIPKFSINGAAMATAFSEVLMALMMVIRLPKNYLLGHSLTRFVSTIIFSLFLFGVLRYFLGGGWLGLVAGCLLGVGGYLVIIWFCGIVPDEDKEVYRAMILHLNGKFAMVRNTSGGKSE